MLSYIIEQSDEKIHKVKVMDGDKLIFTFVGKYCNGFKMKPTDRLRDASGKIVATTPSERVLFFGWHLAIYEYQSLNARLVEFIRKDGRMEPYLLFRTKKDMQVWIHNNYDSWELFERAGM